MRAATAIVGVGLVTASFLAGLTSGRQRAVERRETSLRSDASVHADEVEEYFVRSQAIVRLLAQNPSFPALFASLGEESPNLDPVNDALAYVEQLYPRQIGEACFIASNGRELARVTRGVRATLSELSPNELGNTFVSDTFALGFGQVLQARPYRSPDTGEWVIANSTLMPSADGVKRAMVHFEITVSSFRATLVDVGSRLRIVDGDGRVLIDSAVTAPRETLTTPLGLPEQAQFRTLFKSDKGDVGRATIGSERVAFHRIESGPNNQNDWYVVASAPARVAWTESLGPMSIITLLSGVAVLVLSWRTAVSYQGNLRRQALTDELTGLPNRALLRDRLTQAARQAERDGSRFAVILLDLDRFKEVNDTLGHHRGDELLKTLSVRLSAVMRQVDTLARLGGDEFAVLIPYTDGVMGASAVAERMAEALKENFMISGIPVHVGASIGIAVFPDHGHDVETLLQHADVAMYRAKQAGLDYTVYAVEQDPHDAGLLSLVAELRGAIETNQLELHYQPKYRLASSGSATIEGVEALVRWNHPTRGLISPNDFVPIAERTGLIRPLTSWVLDTGLAQLRRWNDAGVSITMALNISPRNLTDALLLSDIEHALERSGADAARVVLEVTENSFISDPVRSIEALNEIRQLGISVSIDDFGTGYSSLSYLRNLPVDEVKIDRTFIRDLVTDTASQSIVHATIALAHSLGFAVVAEGVEDEGALTYLRAMGCDLAQGFHLGRPVPADQLDRVLAADAVAEDVSVQSSPVR